MGKRKFGSLWEHTNQNGDIFFSGELFVDGKKVDIVVFRRREKINDREPDWDILVARPKIGLDTTTL